MYAKIYVCIPDKSGIHTLHSSLGHCGKFVFPERQQYVSAMGEAIKNGHWQFVCFKKNSFVGTGLPVANFDRQFISIDWNNSIFKINPLFKD